MTYRVDQSSITPPSRQIVEAILDGVAVGTLAPGDKLLSVRALAAEALVNPNTAARAYRDLELMGVLEGRNGRGVYVTEALRAGHTIEALRAVLDGLIQELSS
ncbi:MAG: GntR family transcriptional regulator [Planctomycetota bacterium]|jgi:GntR family transcriptional regulator